MQETNWLNACKICDVALCETVDKLKATGLSENKACQMMATKTEDLYTGDQLRNRYRYHTGKNEKSDEIHQDEADKDSPETPGPTLDVQDIEIDDPTVSQDVSTANPTDTSPDVDDIKKLHNELKNMLKYLPESAFPGGEVITLKGSKRTFSRARNEYPGKGTKEELIIWNTYFLVGQVAEGLRELRHTLYEQLPEELPENQSKSYKANNNH